MADLGWGKSRVKPLGVGLLVGSVLVASVVLTMMIAGWVDLKWIGTWSPLLGAFSFGLTVGLVEETLFRLLWFGGFEPVLGTWLTLAFSAVLFGILHSFNASATLFSSAAIAVTGGLLLGAMFATGRNLWEVVGVHTAWNTALGGFFGLPVSGSDPVPGVFSATVSGPEPWTGGEFGPEASLVSVALVGAVGVWYVLRAREATISVPVWRT